LVTEEYANYIGMVGETKDKFLRDQNKWSVYPGQFGPNDPRSGDEVNFMDLDIHSYEDLQLAKELFVSWDPDSVYGKFPLLPPLERVEYHSKRAVENTVRFFWQVGDVLRNGITVNVGGP
jgi:hypothetical protein